jgi:muramoyltetrapeptide carboxypeptidase LdcA involved in peptidoglycan recycling
MKPGTLGVVSPSWEGAAMYAHRVERGVRQLESMGFQVKIGRNGART